MKYLYLLYDFELLKYTIICGILYTIKIILYEKYQRFDISYIQGIKIIKDRKNNTEILIENKRRIN